MIQAGTLREVIYIQAQAEGQDDAGQPNGAWQTVVTQFARIAGKNGSEEFRNHQFNPEFTHEITTRWVDNITPFNRILSRSGLLLDVLSVDYPERMTELITIVCRQRLNRDDAPPVVPPPIIIPGVHGIEISWSGGGPTYNVYRGMSSGSEQMSPPYAQNVTSPWTDTAGASGTLYFYALTSFDPTTNLESTFSTEVSAVFP